MKADSVTDLESDEDKLNWIFMAFDQDGGGFIDMKENFSQGAIDNFIIVFGPQLESYNPKKYQ